MSKIIGIVSLKGGVGKTSVTTSLGAALAFFGKKVLLIDGNFSVPNLGIHLNVIDPKTTIHDVLLNKVNPSDAIINLGEMDIIPASLFNRHEINYLNLKSKIRHLKRKYDYILIDSSPSLNDETLAVMLAADRIFVVTTPDYPTLSTTIRAVKLARQKGTPIEGLILNKVHGKNFEIGIKDIEKTIEIPVMAVIPYDIKQIKSVYEFKPYSTNFKSKGCEEYKKLAAAISGEKYQTNRLRRYFKINPATQEINRTAFYERVFR